MGGKGVRGWSGAKNPQATFKHRRVTFFFFFKCKGPRGGKKGGRAEGAPGPASPGEATFRAGGAARGAAPAAAEAGVGGQGGSHFKGSFLPIMLCGDVDKWIQDGVESNDR